MNIQWAQQVYDRAEFEYTASWVNFINGGIDEATLQMQAQRFAAVCRRVGAVIPEAALWLEENALVV